MMILLCELAIKSEGIRFSTTLDNEITTKLLSFLIISFLTEKLNIFVVRYLQVDLCLAQGPWVTILSPITSNLVSIHSEGSQTCACGHVPKSIASVAKISCYYQKHALPCEKSVS